MSIIRRAFTLAAAILLTQASALHAQIGADLWRHGTTLAITTGAATAGSDTGPMVGGTIGWGVTRRVGIEGTATWWDRAGSTESFSAALRVRMALQGGQTAPFLTGGVGLYRTSVTAGAPDVAEFYQRRFEGTVPRSGRTFIDPAFEFGGGWTIFVSRHVALQPGVSALVVTRGGHAQVLSAAGVALGYHFESHPVTPWRRFGQ
jgi:hypothetical protein